MLGNVEVSEELVVSGDKSVPVEVSEVTSHGSEVSNNVVDGGLTSGDLGVFSERILAVLEVDGGAVLVGLVNSRDQVGEDGGF